MCFLDVCFRNMILCRCFLLGVLYRFSSFCVVLCRFSIFLGGFFVVLCRCYMFCLLFLCLVWWFWWFYVGVICFVCCFYVLFGGFGGFM